MKHGHLSHIGFSVRNPKASLVRYEAFSQIEIWQCLRTTDNACMKMTGTAPTSSKKATRSAP